VYLKEIEVIKKYLRDNIDVEKSLMLDHERKNLRSQRKMQHIFFKRFSDIKTQKLFEVILIHAEKAERSCPGAGMYLLSQYSNYKNNLSVERPTNLSDLKQNILDKHFTKLVESILLECLRYCKPTSKVSIRKSTNQSSYIEISNRYNFEVDALVSSKQHSGKNAKVIVVDGYVENVSDLHHVFQHFSTEEPTTPFLIFCRGMSDDVLSTITTNNQRGSFECHPFKVNFDLDNVNTLVDIAVVSGCDVTSSLKGELISSINLSNLKKVDEFSRTNQGLAIKNSNNLAGVKQHVDRLRLKSEDVVEDAKKYIFQRIKSLSANSIDIVLVDDINFYSRSQELDEGIRTLISFINNGPTLESVVNEYEKKLKMSLDSIATIIN